MVGVNWLGCRDPTSSPVPRGGDISATSPPPLEAEEVMWNFKGEKRGGGHWKGLLAFLSDLKSEISLTYDGGKWEEEERG